MTSGAERKAALALLLEQEAYLLASIGRHKLKANFDNKEKRDKQFLNKVRYSYPYVQRLYSDYLNNKYSILIETNAWF